MICVNCGMAYCEIREPCCHFCRDEVDDSLIWDDTADGAEAQARYREYMEYARHYGPDDDG